MSDWKGEERRVVQRDDHDVLTRIDANLSNFMKRFDEHAEEDKENFLKVDGRITKLERSLYIALGAIAILELILQIHK